ncbi:MAG TPA: guanine deaminase [Thermohalobaculum sp.]|nr:guanine deaminase [Thermohalobaculum sp.]
MRETTILRGRLMRFAGDPFEIGADAALACDEDGALAMRDGRIVGVGAAAQVQAGHPGATVEHVGSRLIAPGFVDCHVHYPQTGVIASYGKQLIEWLETYTFPEEARFGDPAYAREAARVFFDEALRHGVTTVSSFCTVHPESVDAFFAEAARRGLRALGGKVMMDRNAPKEVRDTAQSGYDQSKALIARWHGVGRALYAVTPRFAPTSTEAQLKAAGALWAEHPDCPMQTHLCENTNEINWVRALFPRDPDYLGVYERHGLLGPGAIFGHAIHLRRRERARLAEAGAAVAHCPTSNQFLGSGECDVAGLAGLGVRVGLASDVGGGSSLSMFHTMKAAYEVAQRRGVSLGPVHLWWLATAGAARALGIGDRVGNLALGLEADAVVLDLESTPLLRHRVGRADSITEILFAQIVLADERAVQSTISGGTVVHAISESR